MSKNPLYNICEVTLIYRNKVKAKERPKITSTKSAYEILAEVWDKNRIELIEQFKIILLDTSNRCLGVSDIATGGVNWCAADSKIIFATALKAKATSLILSHNHPSGNLQPSNEDLKLTHKLVEGGKLLDIRVIDHLIVTNDDYFSMSENGLMP